jgi:hydrogenase-4 transcriptional activator
MANRSPSPADPLALAAWRTLAGPLPLDAALAELQPALARTLAPTWAVYVVEDEPSGPRLRPFATVAGEFPSLRGADAAALLRWCADDSLATGFDGVLAPFAAAAAVGRTRPQALARPLRVEGRPIGFVLALRDGEPPNAADRSRLAALAEPLAVALAQGLRIAELAVRRAAAEADRQALLDRLGRTQLDDDSIVGADRGLRAVLERVALVARSDVPVLLLGETGSGKEVVARAVHRGSARSAGPFLRVNCGAIAPELVDSQLFGHERGSFTGATQRHSGWFERADRGSLLLDEVAELSPAAQVRLLRVLQDGTLERVGGHETLHVDCRIVAATHRDLPRMVQEGSFRQDLWYRLSVFPIVIPPLRERAEDIAPLARHFAHRAARRFGLAECEPTPDDLRRLAAYDWPGNVRELGAVIDRAAILGEGRGLSVSAALGTPGPRSAAGDTALGSSSTPVAGQAFPTLEAVVRAHLEAALTASAGRIEGPRGAAALLGLNPHTLRARMRKLDLDWSRFRTGGS